MSVEEQTLLKMPLDPEGHGHLVALRAHDQLILRRTERGEVLGEVRVPLLIELVAFFRDLSKALEATRPLPSTLGPPMFFPPPSLEDVERMRRAWREKGWAR